MTRTPADDLHPLGAAQHARAGPWRDAHRSTAVTDGHCDRSLWTSGPRTGARRLARRDSDGGHVLAGTGDAGPAVAPRRYCCAWHPSSLCAAARTCLAPLAKRGCNRRCAYAGTAASQALLLTVAVCLLTAGAMTTLQYPFDFEGLPGGVRGAEVCNWISLAAGPTSHLGCALRCRPAPGSASCHDSVPD